MSLPVTRLLTRLGRLLLRKIRQVAGEEHRPKAGHVFSLPSYPVQKSYPHLREGKQNGHSTPVSSTSTLAENGAIVGKVDNATVLSELANTTDLSQRQYSVVMPQYHACFFNLSTAVLDPIDRLQTRSITTCVGWLARFKGGATIHAGRESGLRVGPFLAFFLFDPFLCLCFGEGKSLPAPLSGW